MKLKSIATLALTGVLTLTGLPMGFLPSETIRAESIEVQAIEWDQYANRYIYNQLSGDERQFYMNFATVYTNNSFRTLKTA